MRIEPAQPRGRAGRLALRVELGPYRLAVELRDPATMLDRRRLACVNIEAHRIELRRDLAGVRLAEAFLACLVRLIHFSKGCQQGCIDEAYAHSFATGMVEFAMRNRAAWRWFNRLLDAPVPASTRLPTRPRGAVLQPPAMPECIMVARQRVRLRRISQAQSGKAFGWYDLKRREVQLAVGLAGANLAVVALHEITHAVHHIHRLKERDTHRNFVRSQVKGWLAIVRDNPVAWRWLVELMERAAGAGALRA